MSIEPTQAIVPVTAADREAAASLMSDVGLFSNVLTAKAVQAFARHRLASPPASGEVVAWMYSNPDDLTPYVSLTRWKDIVDGKWVDGSPDWTETPLYAAPSHPAADLVEALRNIRALAAKRQAEGGPDGCLTDIEGFARAALSRYAKGGA